MVKPLIAARPSDIIIIIFEIKVVRLSGSQVLAKMIYMYI